MVSRLFTDLNSMKPNNNLTDDTAICLWICAENLSCKNDELITVKGKSTYKFGVTTSKFKASGSKNGIQTKTRCSGSPSQFMQNCYSKHHLVNGERCKDTQRKSGKPP